MKTANTFGLEQLVISHSDALGNLTVALTFLLAFPKWEDATTTLALLAVRDRQTATFAATGDASTVSLFYSECWLIVECLHKCGVLPLPQGAARLLQSLECFAVVQVPGPSDTPQLPPPAPPLDDAPEKKQTSPDAKPKLCPVMLGASFAIGVLSCALLFFLAAATIPCDSEQYLASLNARIYTTSALLGLTSTIAGFVKVVIEHRASEK